MEGPRFLVIDGYNREARDELAAGGASRAGDLYVAMLRKCLPEAACDIVYPADPGAALPKGAALEQYDGIAWTGCSLTIYEDDPRVGPQIELAKAAYESKVPSFGSCWAAQIAVVAAGGIVRANPRGREMGIARKIALTPEGRGHPLYVGKASVFDAFISHVDEITHLPAGGVLLASNAFTHIQAVSVTHKGGSFWGLQYHPEYDLHELARLTFCRIDKLIKLGFFKNREAALDYVNLLETLHQDPSRKDIAWLLGIDEDVTNEDVRLTEVRNWIERLVLPNMRS
ncbi:type 1 glutamine amidotransferase [Rhodospirillaceae bacterium SYSU D60014]|uniref:type 1 glutamine amidotransferase n=1 Tax=Virgifigura deserti TaxID=2268457 RepID=UPI000E671B8E